jgi:hypothetical protein
MEINKQACLWIGAARTGMAGDSRTCNCRPSESLPTLTNGILLALHLERFDIGSQISSLNT